MWDGVRGVSCIARLQRIRFDYTPIWGDVIELWRDVILLETCKNSLSDLHKQKMSISSSAFVLQ